MLLLFLSSSKQKFYVRGKRVKDALCERCDCEYSYEIERDVIGEDNSLFSWSEKAAFRKAEADGQKKLDKVLDAEDDAAPCPDCGWVQAHMIESVRNQSYLGLKNFSKGGFLFAWVGIAIAVAIPVIAHLSQPPQQAEFARDTFKYASVGLCITTIGLIPAVPFWALRKLLLGFYNPNRNYGAVR